AWALRQPVPLPWSRLRRLRRRGSPPPENKARQARRLQRDKLPVEPASCPKFRHAAGVRSEKTRIRKSDKKLYNGKFGCLGLKPPEPPFFCTMQAPLALSFAHNASASSRRAAPILAEDCSFVPKWGSHCATMIGS